MSPDQRRPSGRARRRTPAEVAAELDEVRRYLRDVPPHHGSGLRASLQHRMRQLERELSRLRDANES